MEKAKKPRLVLLSVAYILFLALAWAGLLTMDQLVRHSLVQAYQPLAADMAAFTARSMAESISDRLDYNRDGLKSTFEAELISRYVQPARVLEHGYAWFYEGKQPLYDPRWPDISGGDAADLDYLLPLPFSQTHTQFVESMQAGEAGVAVFTWQVGEGETLNAWAPVPLEGYDWMVGVSVLTEDIIAVSGWATVFVRMIVVAVPVTVILLMLLVWAGIYNR
ncbi:MAG: hypothetical protein CVU39_12940 [Chloroflexi bacterium HGW-Chloroflexi-10]|nr:MAG: hypothetical protein CVU39_12940 [Chloroflexi bacterium HGW-Chloroflexi-10]